jgi:NADPH-dependent curcumin reductase CurA
MPNADNFELATVSVPHPAPGEVQVENLWMTVDPYMRNRMAHRAYAPSSQPGKEVHEGAIGEIAASNSTMYGWRPPFQLGDALEGGAIGEVAASDDPRFNPGDLVSSYSAGASASTHPREPCRSSIRSDSRPKHSWELPACQG